MELLINILSKSGLLEDDLDYRLLRVSMVIIFASSVTTNGSSTAPVLMAYISNGSPMSWMYPVFGLRGASWFPDLAEWLFDALLPRVLESRLW